MDNQKYSSEKSSAAPPSAPATSVPVSSMASNYNPRARAAQQAEWSTGLCDCFSNSKNCCITCWCPCITFGQIAELVDKGSSSCALNGVLYVLIGCVTGCSCIYSCFYRNKMREQYKLRGSTCNDCLTHCFCECCALCQEYRELENRGFNMCLGWHGNVERQNREIIMAPVIEHGMQR